MSNKKCAIRPIALTVTSGDNVVITIPQQYLADGKFFNLEFCLYKPDLVKYKTQIQGNERVLIQNGVGGTVYILENSRADIFYSDRLILGWCYRIRWGNNGPATTDGATGGVQHFYNCNTPCCSRGIDPANIGQTTLDEDGNPTLITSGV